MSRKIYVLEEISIHLKHAKRPIDQCFNAITAEQIRCIKSLEAENARLRRALIEFSDREVLFVNRLRRV